MLQRCREKITAKDAALAASEATIEDIRARLEERWTSEGLETVIERFKITDEGLRITEARIKAAVRVQPIQLRAEFSAPVKRAAATRAAFGLYDQDDEIDPGLSDDRTTVTILHDEALEMGEELHITALADDWLQVVVKRLPG